MTSPASKIALFAVALVAVFGVGAALGALIDPPGRGDGETQAHGEIGAGEMPHMADSSAAPVRGLGPAENGLRLIVADPQRPAGASAPLRFRVAEQDGDTITDFDLLHTKRLHLIVVRRDLTGFQHLHPRMAEDGTWSTLLRLATPGDYRVFADFSHDEEATTLAGDLRVAGSPELEPLPAPAVGARSEDGYEVHLAADDIRAAQSTELHFEITRGGQPAALQTYLGAGGHLVALRDGDLAFLHVHPEDRGDGEIGFEATFPSAGSYRLFLQFKADGDVETVAFTVEVR